MFHESFRAGFNPTRPLVFGVDSTRRFARYGGFNNCSNVGSVPHRVGDIARREFDEMHIACRGGTPKPD